MGKQPIQPQDKYVVRLPDGMRDRIKAAAEANNRSMNAEIVATLEEKYPAPAPVIGGGHALKILAEIEMIMSAHEMAETQAERDSLQSRYDQNMAKLREFLASVEGRDRRK